jgi:hypothetical protein
LPRAESPANDAVAAFVARGPPSIERTYATIVFACTSEMGFGGIPVLGTPLRMIRMMSSSVLAVLNVPLLKSMLTILSPFSPWQLPQLDS